MSEKALPPHPNTRAGIFREALGQQTGGRSELPEPGLHLTPPGKMPQMTGDACALSQSLCHLLAKVVN